MPQKAIRFFLQDVNYRIQDKNKIIHWLEKALEAESKSIKEVNYILCSDSFLLQLNKNFLKHSTLTDVISFNLSDDGDIMGEIYISIERVKENAVHYGVIIHDELCRVIIHGILHLIGYNDDTKQEKELMREKEDYYLSLR